MQYDLDKFLRAQAGDYETALAEIRAGRKESHWIWYIFPQLRGLGASSASYLYGISGLEEARAYLAHPVLSARLTEISEAMLSHTDKSAYQILGGTDAKKLRSSMTLFALISPEDSVFHRILRQFYGGRMDRKTLNLLGL